MSGMEPALIGAALGGGISAARGGNPLQGALLGGITGVVGSGLMSTLGSTGSVASGAAGSTASGIAAQPALSFAGGQAGAAAAPSGFLGNTMAGIGKDMTAVNAFTKEYPVATGLAATAAKDALFPQQKPLQQGAGLLHGQVAPMAQEQSYQYGVPKISFA